MGLFRRRTREVEKYDAGLPGWSFGGGSGWFANASNIPAWGSWMSQIAGQVNMGTALGLPAVASVIRLFAETTGMVPLLIYQGDPEAREKARDSWQWYRLHDKPNTDQSAFDFFQDVETSIEGWGQAFVWKAKARRVIENVEDIEMYVMDPAPVRVGYENGVKVFRIRTGGEEKTYGASQILHIRGWSCQPGSAGGTSPIALHREALAPSVARQDYESAFFMNNAMAQLAITSPDYVPDEQAKEVVDRFVAQHTGQNAWRPAFFSGGSDIKTLSISAKDAEYIEQKQFSIEEIARMFHLTAVGMLKPIQGDTVSQDFERFLKVDLAPRLRRIELAFKGDEDLFPRGGDMFPEFLTDAILKPDIQTRFAAYKDAVQGGWMEANEIRERENLPEHPDGFGLQQTPVGGAPNTNGQAPATAPMPAATNGGSSNGQR